jgi:hypothetical protein
LTVILLVGLGLQLLGVGPEAVLEHCRADLVPVDDVEVGGLVQLARGRVDRLEHERVFVVDHRLRGHHVTLQEAVHREGLLHVRDRRGAEARLGEARVELIFIAVSPVADRLALEGRDRRDVLSLVRLGVLLE